MGSPSRGLAVSKVETVTTRLSPAARVPKANKPQSPTSHRLLLQLLTDGREVAVLNNVRSAVCKYKLTSVIATKPLLATT